VGDLRLEVCEFESLTRWRWALTTPGGALVADHEVRLDAGCWQYEAFGDLLSYLHWHAAPDRRAEDDAWARMDPRYRDAHRRLWIDVTRRAQPGYVAAPAALLALPQRGRCMSSFRGLWARAERSARTCKRRRPPVQRYFFDTDSR